MPHGQLASDASHWMVNSTHHWRNHSERWHSAKTLPEWKAHREHIHFERVGLARLHKDRLLLFGIFASLVGIRVLGLGLRLLVITLFVLPLIFFVLLALVPERFFVSGLFR